KQMLTVEYDQAGENSSRSDLEETSGVRFEKVDPASLGISFRHTEDSYTDFDRLKLLPYQQSDRGPATAVGDINNDGLMDIHFGGSKHIPGELFIQTEKGFVKENYRDILGDSINEDIESILN